MKSLLTNDSHENCRRCNILYEIETKKSIFYLTSFDSKINIDNKYSNIVRLM